MLESVPGPVLLAYMIAFLAPESSLGFSRNTVPQPLAKLPGLSKGPYETVTARAQAFSTRQLPAVCYNCRRAIGALEGGLLRPLCAACRPGDLYYYQRVAAVNQMVGDGWGTDSLASLILNEVYKVRNKT